MEISIHTQTEPQNGIRTDTERHQIETHEIEIQIQTHSERRQGSKDRQVERGVEK